MHLPRLKTFQFRAFYTRASRQQGFCVSVVPTESLVWSVLSLPPEPAAPSSLCCKDRLLSVSLAISPRKPVTSVLKAPAILRMTFQAPDRSCRASVNTWPNWFPNNHGGCLCRGFSLCLCSSFTGPEHHRRSAWPWSSKRPGFRREYNRHARADSFECQRSRTQYLRVSVRTVSFQAVASVRALRIQRSSHFPILLSVFHGKKFPAFFHVSTENPGNLNWQQNHLARPGKYKPTGNHFAFRGLR